MKIRNEEMNLSLFSDKIDSIENAKEHIDKLLQL